MITKKNKALVAGTLAAAMTLTSVVSGFASATSQGSLYKYGGTPGERSKPEVFGEDTFAERFLSLYDDVMTKGGDNGYLSKTNFGTGGASASFGVPYHSIETMIVEAPDYGHVTTSEAMSYIVWMAALRDKFAADGIGGATASSDYAKAWKTMEAMIPGFGPNGTQKGILTQSELSATYAPEFQTPEEYNKALGEDGNTGKNPLFAGFKSAYSADSSKGYYLMHWLADVDDWYGYGGSTPGEATKGPFTFINTFQRGEQESCWETVPHPSVEEQKFGNSQTGIKGVFDPGATVASWAYTNAPDAEDRALQAVYAANIWGVGDSSITTLAGKMGDQLRNDMFDKYYKALGCQSKSAPDSGVGGQHFLRSWYSAWGGAMDGTWAWQIGASHCHQFYQNPLAAYALLYDSGMKSGMKSSGAAADYEKSFARQIEMYLWLQSPDGPIAGGCTNSWNGRYESYPSGTPTFYDMAYIAHPVYADPPSNNWIGNQLWSVQRLAELYYYVKTDGDQYKKTIAGVSLEDALDSILSKWLDWFLSEVTLFEDGSYEIPAGITWTGQPDTWTGTYSPSSNSKLSAVANSWGAADIGCVASLANSAIYYAAAKGVTVNEALSADDIKDSSSSAAARGLYMSRELLARMWTLGRDNVGVSIPSNNPNFTRLFEQKIFVPSHYTGTMPSGAAITNDVTFLGLRPMYETDEDFARLKADYDADGDTEETEFTYHRFWHAGDLLMATGMMSLLYPDMPVGDEPIGNDLLGDVNVDGKVTVEDVVLLKLNILNAAKYPITAQGNKNAMVVSGTDTIQPGHAVVIQDFVAGILTSLPK